MPTPEEIADNTSSQLKPHKYPSIYFGQANGPSHRIDSGKAYDELVKVEQQPNYDPKVRDELVDKAFGPNKYGPEPSTYRLFHSSDHPFKPGDIVKPTMGIEESAREQGLRGWDDEEEDHDEQEDDEPMAWASSEPLDFGKHTFEVEPITYKHHMGEVRSDSYFDPHETETDEAVSPTGYRVVQEVTPKNAQ